MNWLNWLRRFFGLDVVASDDSPNETGVHKFRRVPDKWEVELVVYNELKEAITYTREIPFQEGMDDPIREAYDKFIEWAVLETSPYFRIVRDDEETDFKVEEWINRDQVKYFDFDARLFYKTELVNPEEG